MVAQALASSNRKDHHTDAAQPHSTVNPFTTFPPEIKQNIFCSLPDVASLEALVTTCSSLYIPFIRAQHIILKEIPSRQMNVNVVSFAFSVSRSANIDPWSKEAVRNFLSYFRGPQEPPIWTLPNALYVNRLHDHVQYFAADFLATKLPDQGPMGPVTPERIVLSERSIFSSCIVTCSARVGRRIASCPKSS